MRKITSTIFTAAALIVVAMALPTAASAVTGTYCSNVLIDAGNTCVHGTYHGSIFGVEGWSTGSAYSGVWISLNGQRVSRDAYCETPGCYVGIFWDTGSTPNGYPALHNHSGFISRFAGQFYFN